MKKYISIAILVVFIIPSIAFASWWNPLSWFNNWNFNKGEKTTEVQKQLSEQKVTSEEKINELQKQIDELKNKDVPITAGEVKKETTINPRIETKKVATPTIKDVCLNIDGIQASVPAGYTWAYGEICSPIVLTDLCPNYVGIQSKIPDGMFIYGDNKECLTQNEINSISDKIAAEKNKEIAAELKANDPIYSSECINAQNELKKVNAQQDSMDQSNYSALADFVVFKVNPALSKVNSACRLNTTLQKLEPTKSVHCNVSYYGSNASVTCYEN